jgi:hypothetical protein
MAPVTVKARRSLVPRRQRYSSLTWASYLPRFRSCFGVRTEVKTPEYRVQFKEFTFAPQSTVRRLCSVSVLRSFARYAGPSFFCWWLLRECLDTVGDNTRHDQSHVNPQSQSMGPVPTTSSGARESQQTHATRVTASIFGY